MVLTFEDGTKGLWKPHKEVYGSNYRAEVLAYEIDQKFGFNLVPPTVERQIGRQKGSVQFFESEATNYGNFWFANKSDIDKQSLFDYLIDNRDRHDGNYLVDKSNRVISIDNGMSFTGKGYYIKNFKEREFQISQFLETEDGQRVLQRLKQTPLDDLKTEISQYLGVPDAEKFIDRVRFIIEYADKN